MVISNLKIGTSYFFTPLAEFAKENIRYLFGNGIFEEKEILAKISILTKIIDSIAD